MKAAIVGASGYSGEELVRLLLSHPHVELTAVTSRQQAGKSLGEVFPRFASHPQARELVLTQPDPGKLARTADIIFLALPHGVAVEFAVPLLEKGKRIIDLSADFRLRDAAVYREFYGHEHPAPHLLAQAVYGLPEIHRDRIRQAQLIACPGCYPTSVLLPLIPLLKARLVRPHEIIADCMSGVSGAGRKADLGFLFVECNESARPYGVPKHRHLSEIEQELGLAANESLFIQFTPHLIPVNRGILTTLYLRPVGSIRTPGDLSLLAEKVSSCYEEAYANEPFVRLLSENTLPDTKNVAGNNFIEIAWRLDPRTGRLLVMSAEDNLLKGASGQAVQNMNIACGWEETTGLL